MFITKKNRLEIYKYLFKEGVIVVEKDNYKPQHDEIEVPNLEVMNVMKSFKSRELVRETYNWLYSYYYLTNKGIVYLREYLGLPSDIVPATLKAAPAAPRAAVAVEGHEDDKSKNIGPGGEFNPEFRPDGGFGRGRDGYRQGAGSRGFGRGV